MLYLTMGDVKATDRAVYFKLSKRGFFFEIYRYKIMQNMTFKDRRVFERISVNLPLKFLNPNSNKECLAQTHDISANGIGILTQEELPTHTYLEIWLQIPDNGKPLHTKGRVVWSKMLEPNRYRVGICLERIDLMGVSRVLRTINLGCESNKIYYS